MAVVFKYKNPVSRNYAPGFVKCGLDGSVGHKGRSGNAVYFVDFDLDNSYDIEMALQKIENNYILANDTIKQLEGREYMVNDLLLSNSGKCYRIIEASEDSVFNNFKYDIQFLGAIKNNTENNIKHIRIYDVTGLRFYSKKTGKLIKSYEPRQKSCWVNNRTEKPYSTDFYALMKDHKDDEDFALYGAWLKMVAVTTADDHQKFTNKDGLTGSTYSFSILLNSNKSYALEGFPCDYSSDPIIVGDETHSEGKGVSLNFKKKLEFPNITVKPEEFFAAKGGLSADAIKTEFLFNEVTKPGAKKKRPSCTTSYMSDYSMDSYHPFGNNVMCTLSAERDMWYKSGVKSRTITEKGEKITSNVPNTIVLNDGLYHEITGVNASHQRLQTIDTNLDRFGAGLSFTQNAVEMVPTVVDYNHNVVSELYSDASEPLKPEWFPKYAAGQSLSVASEQDAQEELDKYTSDASTDSGLILYPKYPVTSKMYEDSHMTNYKGGNSLYFSGIDKYEVPYSIFNFVTSSLNTFQSTIKSAATKEAIVTEVPVLIDTYYRNRSMYVSFVGDDEDDDESFYNTPEDAENDDPTPPSNRDDDTDEYYQHFWSFRYPVHIPYKEGGNSVTVYFITNKDKRVDIAINDSEDIIPQVKLKQELIFSITKGQKITNMSSITDLELDSKYLSNGFVAYPVTITAKYPITPELIETYVGIKLCADTTYIDALDNLRENVISEAIVSYSNPNLEPNVPDASIGDTEEKPDDDRNIYKLTVKYIPGTYWYGTINNVKFEEQTSEISQNYIAKTPYNVTYQIINPEKYYFLEEAKEGETGETVERDGVIYIKKDKINFEGVLRGDLVIGENVIIELVTFDVKVTRKPTNSYLVFNPETNPTGIDEILYDNVPYGTIIEQLPYFYYEIDDHWERQEDDEWNNIILDKENLEFDPNVTSFITKDTTVYVSAIVLDRADIVVAITVIYPNGTVTSNTDTYKEYASKYTPKFTLYPHYQVFETYTYKDADGNDVTNPAVAFQDSENNPVTATFDSDLAAYIVEDPTQYGEMSVEAHATFVPSQEQVVGIRVMYTDWITDEDVEEFIIFGEMNELGTITRPINVRKGDTIDVVIEYRKVMFNSPDETTISDPITDPAALPAYTYMFEKIIGAEDFYSFSKEGQTFETEYSYNTTVTLKIAESASANGKIKINNINAAGDTTTWCNLNIQTTR